MSTRRIAVVGAGLAGLIAAQTLVSAGHVVQLFEKSAAPGGRAATRRRGPGTFDHGAQYATFRDARGRAILDAACAAGVLAPWTARIGIHSADGVRACPPDTERFVGVPDMRALGEWLAQGLDVRYDTAITAVVPALPPARGAWSLTTARGEIVSDFDVVLLTTPAPQARTLLATAALAGVPVETLMSVVDAVPMTPCLAALLTLSQRPAWPWDAAFVHDDAVVAWVARNTSKPRRGGAECWVLHASTPWSLAHVEHAPDALVPHFVAAWSRLIDPTVSPLAVTVHRWRFARPADGVRSSDEAHLDAALGLGVAGDWCVGGRVEGALVSGQTLAQRVLTM